MAARVSPLLHLLIQPLLYLRFLSWDASLMPECFPSFVRSCVLVGFGRLFYSLSMHFHGYFPQLVVCLLMSYVLHWIPLFSSLSPFPVTVLTLFFSIPSLVYSLSSFLLLREFNLLKSGLIVSQEYHFFVYHTLLLTGCNFAWFYLATKHWGAALTWWCSMFLPASLNIHMLWFALKMSAVTLVKEVQLLLQPGFDGIWGPAGFCCRVCVSGL